MECDGVSFLFATIFEAKDTIDALHASQVHENRFVFSQGEILVTGMGKENVLKNTHPTYPVWVNLGIAGAFSDSFLVGDRVWIKSVSEYPSGTRTFSLKGNAHLYTALAPVYEKQEGIDPGALVDMEGYYFAELSAAMKKQLLIGKVVSDHCSKDASILIKERLPVLSKGLALFATSILQARHDGSLLPGH